jgi:hypothetical protein
LLISFSDFRSENEPKFKPKSINITETTTPWGEQLPLINFSNKKAILDTFDILGRAYLAYEVVKLNQEQVDSLSNLAFNYKEDEAKGIFTKSVMGCYTPRNSILFFDKNDKIILNIEMCFECRQIYFYPEKPPKIFNDFCREELPLLKDFFKQCNVHYGVDSLKS